MEYEKFAMFVLSGSGKPASNEKTDVAIHSLNPESSRTLVLIRENNVALF